ncbi:hypothetical protein K2X05_00350, partial [bacterium]|nr:hypothetical protein [bacterium]
MNKIRFTDILFSKQQPIGTCISLYCKDQQGLEKALQEAKKIVAQDHTQEEFKSLFSLLDELRYHWTEYPAAFFVSKNIKGAVPLPIDIENVSVVSTSFHVKPLLRWLQADREFLLLGID